MDLSNFSCSKFYERAAVTREGCWIWKGAKLYNGYGLVSIGGITYLVHRVSYVASVDDIPDGMNVLHRCGTKLCIRPDHLVVGTQKEIS